VSTCCRSAVDREPGETELLAEAAAFASIAGGTDDWAVSACDTTVATMDAAVEGRGVGVGVAEVVVVVVVGVAALGVDVVGAALGVDVVGAAPVAAAAARLWIAPTVASAAVWAESWVLDRGAAAVVAVVLAAAVDAPASAPASRAAIVAAAVGLPEAVGVAAVDA